jgi:opacity protein-like surface antigen
MRKLLMLAALAVCAAPATAQAQSAGEVEGFGGLTIGTSTFGSAISPSFGARVAGNLTENLQAIGEVGRMADIQSPLFDLLHEYAPVGVHVSAFYGEGGVRWLAGPARSAIRPYGEATAGFAKLNVNATGVPGGIIEPIVDTAIDLVNTTRPVLGIGGGLQIHGGPVAFDIGYRYKKISAGNAIVSALDAGNDFHINEVRVGLGFRF